MTNVETTPTPPSSGPSSGSSSGQPPADGAPPATGTEPAATHPKTDAPSAASAKVTKKSAPAAKKTAKKTAKKAAKKSTAKKSAPDKAESASAKAPEARSAAEIQADIDAAQVRLAAHVDELSDRLNPQHLAEEAVSGVKRLFLHEDGSPKGKPIAIAAGGLTALVVLRKIFHRG